jgi:hypothetical protein
VRLRPVQQLVLDPGQGRGGHLVGTQVAASHTVEPLELAADLRTTVRAEAGLIGGWRLAVGVGSWRLAAR